MKQVLLELVQQKRALLIVLGILLLLNVGLYVFLTLYLVPSTIASQKKFGELRQRVAVAGKADVASVYRQGTDDLKKISARVPAKRQFVRVLGDLLDTAAASGVVTGNVSYKPQSVKGQDILAYGISMSVSGSYAAVKSFLGDLQKNSELIVVDGINLANGDPFEENVVLELKVSMYMQNREGA